MDDASYPIGDRRLPALQHNALNIVITGGSSGIGRALVQRFCEAGHNVLFTYYNNKAGAYELVTAYPDRAQTVHCDQGDVNSISNL